MNGIEVYTTYELIEELFKRHDTCVVITEKTSDGSTDETRGDVEVSFSGDRLKIVGLLHIGGQQIVGKSFKGNT